jgi:hypothetical protein
VQLVCIVTPSVVMVTPETSLRLNVLVEHLPLVIFVRELIKLVGIRSEFCDEYQTCPKILCQS